MCYYAPDIRFTIFSNACFYENVDTPVAVVESAFRALSARADVGIILINQHVANNIRHVSN